MKKLMIGLGWWVAVSAVSFAEQGMGVGGSYYTDGIYGPMLQYEWMFSKYVGLDLRASYLIGSLDTPSEIYEEHFNMAGQMVFVQSSVQGKGPTSLQSSNMRNTTAVPLEMGVKFACPADKWTPYLILGGGYYIYEGVIETPGWAPDTSPKSVLGFWGAAGLEANLKENLTFFAEVKYTKATWNSEEDYSGRFPGSDSEYGSKAFDYTGTLTTDGGLDGIGGSIGIRWKF